MANCCCVGTIGISRQEVKRHFHVVVVVNHHPGSASFTAPFKTTSEFAHYAGSRNYHTHRGLIYKIIGKFCPFRTVHQFARCGEEFVHFHHRDGRVSGKAYRSALHHSVQFLTLLSASQFLTLVASQIKKPVI
jgi:hypothetical protein